MIRGDDAVLVHANGLAKLVRLHNDLSGVTGHLDFDAVVT
jgi:hypothetical protein